MNTLSYYVRTGLVWLWFLFSFTVGCFFLIFRWGDPSVSSLVGKILRPGADFFMNIRSFIHNQERMMASQPCVYVVNHQSNLDIMTMSDLFPPNTILIGKKELLWVPVFNFFFYGTANIYLDRKNSANAVAAMKEVAERVRERGVSVWVFPEGTRNKTGKPEMLPFKKGAFRLAIQAQIPIQPIIHQFSGTYVSKTEKRLGGVEVHMTVLEPVQTKGMTEADTERLMAEVRARMEAGQAELAKMPVKPI